MKTVKKKNDFLGEWFFLKQTLCNMFNINIL